MKVVIAGAGLTGLSCALALGKGARVFERENEVGGLCRTERRGGFTIDHTGHYLHFRDRGPRRRVERFLGRNLGWRARDSWVMIGGRAGAYPFQTNLNGHDPAIVRDCVAGFYSAREDEAPARNGSALDWVRSTQGEGFLRHFMIPFNEKQFRARLSDLTPEQWGRFLPPLSSGAVMRGALGRARGGGAGYNAVLGHPLHGGIQVLPEAMAASLTRPVERGREITSVRWKDRAAVVNGREAVAYDALVATGPLRETLSRLDPPPPAEVAAAGRRLSAIGVLNIHLCVRGLKERRRHWIYVPERRYSFYRFGFPSNINPADAPRGHGIISVEVSYRAGRRPEARRLTARVKRELRSLGFLGAGTRVVDSFTADIPCAYVVFDRHRSGAVSAARRFLARHRILSIGRYGSWSYGGMEDAIVEGAAAGEALRIGGPRGLASAAQGRGA